MNVELLREFITYTLCEKAQTAVSSVKRGLALAIINGLGDENYYVLYDPERALNAFQKNVKDPKGLVSTIYGLVSVKHPHKEPPTIHMAVAKSGYGPLLYDTAMSYEGELAASTTGVSSDAYNVWNYYATKREDIRKRLLKNRVKKKKKPDSIDYAYSLTGSAPNVSSLISNHKNVQSSLTGELSKKIVDGELLNAAITLFSKRYW